MKQLDFTTKCAKTLFALLALLLGGVNSAWAQKTLPYSYGFETTLAAEGWTMASTHSSTGISTDAKHSNSYGFFFNWNTNPPQYLISPELAVPTNGNNVKVSFYYKAYSTSYEESFQFGYSTTTNETSAFTWEDEVKYQSTDWAQYTSQVLSNDIKYVAIRYTANNKYKLYIDDIEMTCDITGPALSVYDGEDAITTGYAYNFGLATAGTTKTFTLKNPGTEDVNVATTSTIATLSAATIAAKGEVTLTITMPETTITDQSVTITSSTTGIDDFTINVSGTVRDANKFFETFAGGNLPDNWASTGGWSFSSAEGGYASQTSYSNYRLSTPKLTFDGTEKLMFEAAYYSSASYVSFKVQYSADGTNWTDATLSSSTFNSTWTSYTADIPAGNYYIGFYVRYAYLRNVYGGTETVEPKMVVTQPASLDFGTITEATAKTFTIANTGKATLEGISVASSNSSVFAISGAPTSLAAGASADVTITMAASTAGDLSSTITVSATSMDDVTFTVTGQVLPTGLSVIDFNDNTLPARWENTGWSFTGGAAYAGYHSPAYVMTTPKIVVNEGDLFVVKGKIEYNSSSYYVTVKGLNASGTEVYSKKLTNDVFNNSSYKAVILSDIPTTVNKLQFVGYYAYIDEIQGINYAAELAVTKDEAAVASPANYDFGECGADATVTYNFANAGTGTINITGVAITGDGAASYSTNWTTSVAAPFDLVITRTYDAAKAGSAQVAVVTVTTTEGTFVINVTGTDKAANAPELAVSTTAIDFGKVTADATETITVTNEGTGSMTVNIASDNTAFEVSAASLTEIAAGASKTFDVTFKYGTPYGVKNANITVTPTYDTEAAVTITATGKAKDPEVWSEDFAGEGVPTGWDAGANWTIADGVAKGTSGSYGSTSNYLTTPTLTVSGTDDELTFDYKVTSNYTNVKIQYAKDGGAFTDYSGSLSWVNTMDEFATMTITGLEAGDYQFRFANDAYQLDNFEGFKLNLADHIATISAYTIPTSTNWNVTMKEGQSFDATVTVKEMRGVEEALTAKLYMGEEVIGTATGSVAGNSKETLTITATPTVAAVDGIAMHIEVEWAGETLKTAEETRYVAAITRLTLDETSSDAVVAGTYDFLTLKRTFAAGWNTVCLPFTVSDVEDFFGEGAKAYDFSNYSDGELSFSAVTELTASYPYIVYVPAAITTDIELTDITIVSNNAEAFYRNRNNAYFKGTYAPMDPGTMEGKYGVTSEAKIAKGTEKASMKGFRAYFELPEGATVKALSFDDGADGIRVINAESELDGQIFDLNGRKVSKTQRGVYIVNGQKVVVR